jgi:hypothetical protein
MKATPSSMFEKISGRSGNVVFRNTNQGIVINSFYNPNTFITSNAIAQKQLFSEVASYWRAASLTIKNNYATVCSTYTFYDRFNQPFTPNAYQLFLALNIRAHFLGGTWIYTPEVYSLLSIPVAISIGNIIISTTSFSVSFAALGGSGNYIQLYIVGPHFDSPIGVFKRYSPIAHHENDAPYAATLYSALLTILGREPITDEYYTLWYMRCNITTGLVSSLTQQQVIVQATP